MKQAPRWSGLSRRTRTTRASSFTPASSLPRRDTAPMPGASSLRPTRSARRCCRQSSTSSAAITPVHSAITQETDMKNTQRRVPWLAAAAGFLLIASSSPALASSHMDAPLITLDDAANTTDVYAFLSQRNGLKYLTTALAVYPHEEPGVGPNKYNFDDDVLYEMHVATGDDVKKGRTTFTYQFVFETTYRNRNTILQSYLGVIDSVGDASQNLIQRYTVNKVDGHTGHTVRLGRGIVPPNNQGNATPRYNRNNDGEQPARDGVANDSDLDVYTAQSIADLRNGYVAFAGQRDDGFYADIQAIFDLLKLRSPGVDSQGGFNIHLLSLVIPVSEIGGDQQVVGVYATTSRRSVRVLQDKHG